MRLHKLVYVLTAIFVLVSGCRNSEKITISGIFPNNKGGYLHINQIEVNNPIYVDSVKIGRQGNFKTSFHNNLPEFYNIGLNNSEYITIVAYPGDNIVLTFLGETLHEDYRVEGSKESEDIRLLDIKLAKTIATLDSLRTAYENIPGNGELDNRRKELEDIYLSEIQKQRMHNIGYIIENLTSFSSIKALYQRLDEDAYVLYKPTDAQYLKLVSDSLNALYPMSKQAIALSQNLQTELNELQASRLSTLVTDVESTDLDVDLTNINGKRVKLSSLRGKSYVLLCFWSTQSKECITNNLQMKEFYRRYNRKGFEIYQVNLDADENSWKSSVRFDEIPWISVREDDPANPETAQKYNVTKVPANYLIDKNGKIVGKNLFGRTLQIKLNQLFD